MRKVPASKSFLSKDSISADWATDAVSSALNGSTASTGDTDGNTSGTLATLTVAVDTPAAPAIASFLSEADTVVDAGVGVSALTLVGSAEANSTVNIFDKGVLLGTATADANGAWRFRTGTLLDGAHDFTSTVTDAAGKTSAASAAFSVMLAAQALAAAPTIASSLHDASVTNLVINDTADHVINATESTAVAFTISGLKGNETGAVTFTDAANHQVVVNVGANGSYAADLSTLTDGTITSSLAATSPSGNTTSATGNAVTLDTDRGLTPTVSVNALDPAHVTFTISGLEGDESGTMTFTDINGKQVVVDVGSNGNYFGRLVKPCAGPGHLSRVGEGRGWQCHLV